MPGNSLLSLGGDLRLKHAVFASDHLELILEPRRSSSRCPLCSTLSRRVHSRYSRSLADLPMQGTPVRLQLLVRKFKCVDQLCPRKIFCERLPDFAPAYARFTCRLSHTLTTIGFALGGQAGSRLAAKLGMSASGDTILQLVRAAVLPAIPEPRVIGVDDWAIRRGQNYGTIIVDLERRRPIDLINDRDAETLSAWLEPRSGIEAIARDRAKGYAEGATAGAPNAVQVADRFHLVRNAVEAFERVLNGKRAVLREAAENVSPRRQTELAFARDGIGELPQLGAEPHRSRDYVEQREKNRARRLARYQEVHRLRREGESISGIARVLKMHRETVRIFLEADTFPERAPAKRRASKVRPYATYLADRWSQGCRSTTKLYQELREQGYTGTKALLRRYLKPWREKWTPLMRRLAELPDFSAPSPKQAVWLLLKPETATTTEQKEFVKELLRISPEISEAYELVREFRRIAKARDEKAFDAWLAAAKAGVSRELRGFATGLEAEGDVVRAALRLEWSTGQVEGHIHRLKLLKRQMYGRAKLDLLRQRVLYAA